MAMHIFNEDNLLVKPTGDNILQLVKNKLGIKDVAKPAVKSPVGGVRKP